MLNTGHHQAIREYLNIASYQNGGEDIVVRSIREAAQSLNDPADLINVAIEQLIYHRFELPAYSRLERIANHIRTEVNTSWYQLVKFVIGWKLCTMTIQYSSPLGYNSQGLVIRITIV